MVLDIDVRSFQERLESGEIAARFPSVAQFCSRGGAQLDYRDNLSFEDYVRLLDVGRRRYDS